MKTAAKKAHTEKLQNAVPAEKTPDKDNFPASAPGQRPAQDALTVRGLFARSLCKAHYLVVGNDRAACDDGTACARSSECLKLADNTLTYLEYRNRLPKND